MQGLCSCLTTNQNSHPIGLQNLANFLQADVFHHTYICRFYFLQQELSLQTTDRAILVVVFKESLNTRKQSLLQSCMQGCNPKT
jgi:hypothetical protein